MESINNVEIADLFATMWKQARTESGMSQANAAKAMGVSKTTIQNWEDGLSCPSQKQGFAYFKILGVQPLPYYLRILYPQVLEVNEESTDEQVDAALCALLKDCSMDVKRKLLYVAYGDHGSSPIAVLDMVVAHLHTPLISRLAVADIILNNYKLAKRMGRLVGIKNIQPNLGLIETALSRAQEAVVARGRSYNTCKGGDEE